MLIINYLLLIFKHLFKNKLVFTFLYFHILIFSHFTNLYRRVRYGTSLATGGIPSDTPNNGSVPQLKAFTVQKGTYSPTDVILGTFQVIKPGTSTRKVMASVSKHDFVGKYILSDSRTLTPQEELTVPQLPDWYIIPPEIKRICEHAKLTTNTASPIRNFLLRGPAGTGKTEGAKAIASGLHLPYRCITCSANTEIFDLLGQILPDVDGKLFAFQSEYFRPADDKITIITRWFFHVRNKLCCSYSCFLQSFGGIL